MAELGDFARASLVAIDDRGVLGKNTVGRCPESATVTLPRMRSGEPSTIVQASFELVNDHRRTARDLRRTGCMYDIDGRTCVMTNACEGPPQFVITLSPPRALKLYGHIPSGEKRHK